ncbi:Gryzun, putative trafficking through golgi-domain-containing protein [Lineolata rhizophorae]|uniref:Gryzun, putative trafficking through golgi-domain-containing protein n=1 Tax=Lineolata rhizophorae TaxID=578093 RepID=A0A6A6PA12_9PEZI|nr:Gryzun, putative trafficking through golgi-domain-containing protein [Lineolata rhizophorae]
MTPLWVAKHQHNVPAVFVAFFSFTSDPSRNSLHDNQLKSEINSMKAALARSDYKTRLAVVLLSDKTILQAPDIEERLGLIRRTTGLDPKNSLFFLPPNTSRVELSSFVSSVLTALHPICIDYYRDLTKHARRKKTRSNIPPPTLPPTKGTSQTLPHHGWVVRYDVKLGIFAEFRQEMDVAGRHYGFALDNLLGADAGVFETTPSWSTRWDELRLLADSAAIRIVRCFLWSGHTAPAVQAWTSYRERVRALLDRRGRGANTYGWEAWQARWTRVMAELIQRADLPAFQVLSEPSSSARSPPPQQPKGDMLLFVPPPEKPLTPSGNRIAPWHLLHHPGYWLRLSAQHTIARRALAREIPEEDRMPPEQSSAHAVAHRSATYDTYLCAPPHIEAPLPPEYTGDAPVRGVDHAEEIVAALNAAISQFALRSQHRFVERLSLDLGTQLLEAGRWRAALDSLAPLWQSLSWRTEGWWPLVARVAGALRDAAVGAAEPKWVVCAEWELMSRRLGGGGLGDLMGCLEGLVAEEGEGDKGKVGIKVEAEKVVSFLDVSCVFLNPEDHVGEPVKTQLMLKSDALPGSSPVTFESVRVEFGGSGPLTAIELSHLADQGSDESESSRIENISLTEMRPSPTDKPTYAGTASLTVHAGQALVFAFPLILREAGDVVLRKSIAVVNNPRFKLTAARDYQRPPSLIAPWTSNVWWLQQQHTGKGAAAPLRNKRLLSRVADSVALRVLPKPPKVEIVVNGLRQVYYTAERVELGVTIENREDEDVEGAVEVRVLSGLKEGVRWKWVSDAVPSSSSRPSSPSSSDEQSSSRPSSDLPGHPLPCPLAPGASTTATLALMAPVSPADNVVLELKALYHLLSDQSTPISKTLSIGLAFVSPFEADYEWSPRLHPDPWPSYFAVTNSGVDGTNEGMQQQPVEGLIHKWNLLARIVSFATEPLRLEEAHVHVLSVSGGSSAPKVTARMEGPGGVPVEKQEGVIVKPKEMTGRGFGVCVAKRDIEDRRPIVVEAEVRVKWRRVNGSEGTEGEEAVGDQVEAILPIPRLMAAAAEPRVIASCVRGAAAFTVAVHDGEEEPDEEHDAVAVTAPPIFLLTYTLENPTTHFLTFDLAMDAAENFAFSGPKLCAVHLLPYSRQNVSYRLLPLLPSSSRPSSKEGRNEGEGETDAEGDADKWMAPVLRVTDRYFNKKLVPLPGEGVVGDGKRGVLVWVGEE